ncbi:thioredoxin family protein [Burkholderia sp. MSMB1072]|uniref:thioredoxin family protein n=1 Tax=Burkholderia sp. MSMB1072 TaxID=1637871 RepID=UPI0015D0CE32|nr:thioredoxin family protein [Burkholderia sp. MSMB1072]
MKQIYDKLLSGSSTAPEVVIFTAPWCGPCKMLKPALQALKADYGFNCTEINAADISPEDLETLGVRGVPNLRVLQDGVVKAQFSGARTRAQVEDWLTSFGVIARGLSFE